MLGIVVLNYNTWNETQKCISSLLEINQSQDFHIYLIDNKSVVKAPRNLVEFVNQSNSIDIIWNDKNYGYNAGNNVGVKRALQDGCDYILISNNDVTYEKDTIGNMLSYMKLHPDVGIVGPKIIETNESVQEINMLIPTTLGGKYKYLLGRTPLRKFVIGYLNSFSKDVSELSNPFVVSSVSGACFLVSRECCGFIYPFDEFPFLYEEEIMLGIEMSKTNFKTVFDTKAVIHHDHGATTHGITAFSFTEFVRSEIYYCLYYLNSKKSKVIPLYLIRCCQYLSRCILNSDYSKNFGNFFSRTRESFKKVDFRRR